MAMQPPLEIEALTDTNGAAQYLKIPAKTLQKWRSTGYANIPYIKIGRKVRYRPSDLRTYVDRHLIVGAIS
ncbi:MAG: helix-turn-helix domain-containing protein [Methylovulum sp.]|nr:helix-turn-helix domain-containing protein [Methylovulum sp.]MCF7999866.1 helix-turn-helix domain-containing protein [Methylovulum sp.]